MKRYDIVIFEGDWMRKESPDGDYVRYEDAHAEIAHIHDKLKQYRDLIDGLQAEIARLRDEVDEYQQEQDEIIVALGSRGILPSAIASEVKRLKRDRGEMNVELIAAQAEVARLREHLDACSDTCGFQARRIKKLEAVLEVATHFSARVKQDELPERAQKQYGWLVKALAAAQEGDDE